MKSRHLFRASCATGAVMGGVLAVLTASAHAAGESTTAMLTGPTSGSSAVFTSADVELASQQHTVLPQGQGVPATSA